MVVTCDKRLIRIALENLLSNALKFSARKEKPTVVVGEKNENGRRVFFVKDNGVGFNMNHYQKLFVLFKRLHSERDFKGTGIGLVTVQRIIERHKGEIWAEGEENKGATFYFTL